MNRIGAFLQQPIHIAPLITFRMMIGAIMFLGTLRFISLGWIEQQYIAPQFHFRYFGFEWLSILPSFWIIAIHILMLVAAVGVLLGAYFRWSAIVLFLSFTYLELIDLTYYLNHYYFMSLVLGLLIFTPAHRYFSLDAQRRASQTTHVPRLWIFIFQLLLAIVYTYAGLAKINSDWLLHALPLKIWLPAQDQIPILGPLFAWKFAPIIFSWAGMLYDCTIVFFLWYKPTRLLAYFTVVTFHAMTGLLFQIGVFPIVMIGATLIFFSERWHLALLGRLRSLFRRPSGTKAYEAGFQTIPYRPAPRVATVLLGLFFLFQLLFPWRYLLYPGNLFWTEQGYRFSWRVMLMEKAGTATFYVKDSATGREGVVVNSEFLNAHQEKQMSMQPDMILQFAHHLHRHYAAQGLTDPQVRAEVYVTLNARPSKLLIDPQLNLAKVQDAWRPKPWITEAPQ